VTDPGAQTAPPDVRGQPYTCRVTVTGTGAERQGGDSHLPPADDGRLTPEQAAQLLFDDPRATVNLEARDEAQARSALEECARLFEKAPGVVKDALDSVQADAETLPPGAPPEGGTRRIAQGSSECIAQMTP
jgi:hypothetical protein